MRSRLGTAVAAVAVCAGMTACGGGGGSGEAATEPIADGITGLVPAAPPAGATLYADATALLPLKAGAAWHYRGTSPTGTESNFGVLVRHQAAGSATSAQRQSTRSNDDQRLTYTVSGGSVTATDPDGIVPGTALTYTVLRSPVRQSEQITLVDRTGVPSGVDIDGDKLEDLADVAVYSRVVGNEQVDLPDLQQTVTALRLDTTAVARIRPSGGGPVSAAISQVQSQWFAPGIGIVRAATTPAVTGTAGPPYETDERLVFWDGVGQGLGALPPQSVRERNATVPLGRLLQAVRSGDRVFVMTEIPGAASQEGFALSVLDANAGVQATRSYNALRSLPGAPLVPVAGGVALVSVESLPPTPFVSFEIRLRRFGPDALAIGDPAGVVLTGPLLLGNVAVAGDGAKLWMMWSDASTVNGGTERIWLQDFGFDGQPIGAPRLLDSVDYFGAPTGQFSRLRLASAPDRVLASWGRSDFGGLHPTMKLALLQGTGTGALRVQVLGVAQLSIAPTPQPVVAAVGQALTWSGLAGFGGFSNTDDHLLRGLAIADDASLLRSAAPTLDAEVLAARTGMVQGSGPSTDASDLVDATTYTDGSQLQAAVVRNAVMLPGSETAASSFLEFDAWTALGSPLAAARPDVRRLRLSYVGFAPVLTFSRVRAVVPLDDRLLALGDDDHGQLAATIVYRP